MEENISSVPTERVKHFERRQRHQGRQPQTSTQRGQHRNDEVGPSTSTQPNMYSSTQVGPSTFAGNEPTTLSEYNPINVNEYCINLFQNIGKIPTSTRQGFENLFSYDHYSQPSSTLASYHPSPPPSYVGQYNYGQDSQYIYNFYTPQPSQASPNVGDFCTPPNTWACASNSEEEASVTDSEEDASNEDNGEDAENSQHMEVSSDNESDEGGNYQTEVDIRTLLRCMGRSLMQVRRYPQRVNRHPPCSGTQQKFHVPHRRNHYSM